LTTGDPRVEASQRGDERRDLRDREVEVGLALPEALAVHRGDLVGRRPREHLDRRAVTRLDLAPGSGLTALGARPASGTAQASGAIAFDRSPFNAPSGYRFLVSFPADFVIDATPSVTPVSTYVVR
jgi:hypothetical protein